MLKEILQGRFLGHPLHPVLVHLPIGLWMASFVFDIINLLQGNSPGLAVASYYCIGLGLVGALLSTPAGIAEYIEIPPNTIPRTIATRHFILNIVVIALYAIGFFLRRDHGAGSGADVTVGQFLLSLASIVFLSISGYLGGMLVYHYGIGLRPESRTEEKKTKTRRAA